MNDPKYPRSRRDDARTSQSSSGTREPAGSGLIGFLILAQCVVGVGAGLVVFSAVDKRDFTGAGVCLLAAAISFGALLNGLLRR